MKNKVDFGTITTIDIREGWKNEEYDFTPWLAQEQNIGLLGNHLGIDIELEGAEVAIGSFKADIVANDMDGNKIIIENQLDKTDHKHLGQLITYASGMEAKTVIWICSKVTDEHRNAIDWLNEMTFSEISFFACEIELLKIGDSLPAPRFKVIASPNDWGKMVKSKSHEGLTAAKSSHLDFWNAFKEYMEKSGTSLSLRTPRAQHWYSFSVGRSKFHIAALTNTQRGTVGCNLYMGGSNCFVAMTQLRERRSQIEAALGELEWREEGRKSSCTIVQHKEGNTLSKREWPQLHAWLKDRVESFHEVFSPLVKGLEL